MAQFRFKNVNSVVDTESRGLPTSSPSFNFLKFKNASATSEFRETEWFRSQSKNEILQLHASGLPNFKSPAEQFIKPAVGWRVGSLSTTFSEPSSFSRLNTPIWDNAQKFGQQSEAEAVDRLYSSWQRQIDRYAAKGRTYRVGAYNAAFDIPFLHSVVWRNENLAAKWGDFWKRNEGRLDLVQMEDPVVSLFSKWSGTEAGQKVFGGSISPSSMKYRKGWSVGNILDSLGTSPQRGLHDAAVDVRAERQLYARFARAHNRVSAAERAGTAVEWDRLAQRLTSNKFQDMESFAVRVFGRAQNQVDTVKLARAEARAAFQYTHHIPISKAPLYVAAAIAATAMASSLAFGDRKSRQSQITGLADLGIAQDTRHKFTDFGSGYRGQDDSPSLKAALTLATGISAFAFHKYKLLSSPTYAQKAYKIAKAIEVRSPGRVLATLRTSESLSSYLPKTLTYAHSNLFFSNGALTRTGELLQTTMGRSLKGLTGDLQFSRTKVGSPYLTLTKGDGLGFVGQVQTRFVEHGTLAGAGTRFKAALYKYPSRQLQGNTAWNKTKDWYSRLKYSQKPRVPSEKVFFSAGGHDLAGNKGFFPLYSRQLGKSFGQSVKDAANAAHYHAFTLAERTQSLLSQAGLGLKQGSYNKLANIPFLGEGGLINQYLTKRYMPAYAGAAVLGYADYLTGHVASNALIGAAANLSLVRAEATDRVPGARAVTDFYKGVVPGPQYGPIALPAAGAFVGSIYNYFTTTLPGHEVPGTYRSKWADKIPGKAGELLKSYIHGGKENLDAATGLLKDTRIVSSRNRWVLGALVGAAAMLPFVPGMVGSRDTSEDLRQQFSGEQMVAVRSGRWWDMGDTPFEGGKISYFRPHWFYLHKQQAEKASLWDTEGEYWSHHPVIHPLKWLSDPYALEAKHYWDRPYQITSPAFADVPLVGPLLAGTIGKLIKPPVVMHEGEWSPTDYNIGSALLKPRGPFALPGERPEEEFGFLDVLRKERDIFFDFTGLPGWMMKAATDFTFGGENETPMMQGSRQISNLSKSFYERNLGQGFFLSEGLSTEPIRRFIQREERTIQVNDVPNTMPSWMPGPDDYAFSFRHGDPYARIAEGYARLPGPGYAALHPELQGLSPEDYPDITKFSILADVAYGSTQYFQYKNIAESQAQQDMSALVEYEKITDRVKKVRESRIGADQRKFSGEVDRITGTVESVGIHGIALQEYPGRIFSFAGAGMTASDMSALALGEANVNTRSAATQAAIQKMQEAEAFLQDTIGPGSRVNLTVPFGAAEHSTSAPASVFSGNTSITKQLISRGLAKDRIDEAGPEARDLFGPVGSALGSLAEGMSFSGDQSPLNPLRYIPSPAHTKFWQERTPLEQYKNRQVYGASSRRWENPLSDFIGPYFRGMGYRLTGNAELSQGAEKRRELDTLSDMMSYLQGLQNGHTNQARRTVIGGDLFRAPESVASVLPNSEKDYFLSFVRESNPETRHQILSSVGPQMAQALQAQWVRQEESISQAEGRQTARVNYDGRLIDPQSAKSLGSSGMNPADASRAQEIAEFFSRSGYSLPEADSQAYSPDVDQEDVKLKIIQNEGYDMHDFGIFPDRAAVLWRKPYVNGAVRELTSGGNRSEEGIRRAVEEMILASRGGKNPRVTVGASTNRSSQNTVSISHHSDSMNSTLSDIRRNREDYN